MNKLFSLILLVLLLAGCSENPFTGAGETAPESTVEAPVDGKLRHPQLKGRSSGTAGKDGTDDSQLFLAFNEYEADGVTRRVIDAYGVTRRILAEYGVTRRVLESFGVTKRILEQYGVSRRVLESYAVTRRVLESYGITAEVLEANGYALDNALLRAYGTSFKEIEAHGVSRRVLEEYAITRRVLTEYSLSDAEFDAALAAWERTIKLKVRIDAARPGIFVSIGTLPFATFMEEIADDADIAFAEIDVTMQGPAIGSIIREVDNDRNELLPWGVDFIGSRESASVDASKVHVYVLDSGVYKNDLNVVERKDFTMLFENRNQTHWDDGAFMRMPYFDPGDRGNPEDGTGHGSHIAGTIGALANGRQVIGVAPGAQIHSIKVLTDQGQTDVTTLLAAIDYVIAQKLANPTRPMVMNMSLGMDIESTAYNVLDEGVQRAIQNNILVVVSAGNSGTDASTYSPAHVKEALTVGAFGLDTAMSTFSNHGEVVDLHAPGDLIASLSNNREDIADNLAILESGTSMATAHVTGAAALILAGTPQASPSTVTDVLLARAKPAVTGAPLGTTDLTVWAGPARAMVSSTDESSSTSTTGFGSGSSAPQSTTPTSTATEPTVSTSELPPFYSFAITSGIITAVDDETGLWIGFEDAGFAGNASVFSNEFFVPQNPDIRISGFAYDASPYDPGDKPDNPTPSTRALWMDEIAQPNYNPADLPGNLLVDRIEIPYLDVQAHRRMANRATKRNLVLEGHYDLGTEDNPVVWYVGGNVSTRGNVTFSGFGVLLVKGSISISHDISDADGSSETRLGLYADNGITFRSDNLTVAAHVFSNSNVMMQRTLTLYGNITAGGIVGYFSPGKHQLFYREPPRALTDIFWPVN